MLVWVILSRPTVYIWVVMKECWHYLLNYCAYFLDKDSLSWHDLNRLCVHKYVLMVRIIILIEAIKHLASFGSGADCLDDEFIWNTYDVHYSGYHLLLILRTGLRSSLDTGCLWLTVDSRPWVRCQRSMLLFWAFLTAS